MPTSLTPINAEGQRHGYWEEYFYDGTLWFRGNYINGIRDGYWEFYCYDGKPHSKGTYKNGMRIGLWEIHYIFF